MKHTDVFILAVALLSFSCSGQEDSNSFSAASIRTLSEIVGFYSMTCLEWDSPVDISGYGLVSSDILLQMKTYGFYGVTAIHLEDEPEARSVFDANDAMMQTGPNDMAQVNIYIPYFTYSIAPDGTIDPLVFEEGVCPARMTVYQFHYNVDKKGVIELMYPDRWAVYNSYEYSNITVALDNGCIYFEGDTVLYDYNRGDHVKGRLSATFVKS